jgi:hypothetical protein
MGKGLFVCFFFVFSQISLGSREKFRKHEEEEEIRSSMQKKANDEDSLVLIFSPKAATVAA